MTVTVESASAEALVLSGRVGGLSWRGEYARIEGSLAYVRIGGTTNTDTTCWPLPHGAACVLPRLLGRAVLYCGHTWAERGLDPSIMAHEAGHVLAHRGGQAAADYGDNEALADRLAARI